MHTLLPFLTVLLAFFVVQAHSQKPRNGTSALHVRVKRRCGSCGKGGGMRGGGGHRGGGMKHRGGGHHRHRGNHNRGKHKNHKPKKPKCKKPKCKKPKWKKNNNGGGGLGGLGSLLPLFMMRNMFANRAQAAQPAPVRGPPPEPIIIHAGHLGGASRQQGRTRHSSGLTILRRIGDERKTEKSHPGKEAKLGSSCDPREPACPRGSECRSLGGKNQCVCRSPLIKKAEDCVHPVKPSVFT